MGPNRPESVSLAEGFQGQSEGRQIRFHHVVLHLKAGRGRREWEGRNEQCARIAEFIEEATSGTEEDILIVGDYNMIPGRDDSNFVATNPTKSEIDR